MKQKSSHLRSVLAIAFMFLVCAATAQADISLGTFNFNSSQFGDTLVEADGGIHSGYNWLNTSNVDPGNPGYLTGPNFNTGIANCSNSVPYIIGYNTPIVNNAGADFGVVVARYSTEALYLAVSADGGSTWSADQLIPAASAVATGVNKVYYYYFTGPSEASLFVHPIDIADFGFIPGATINAVRLKGIIQLDLVRAAGFATVPLPGAMWLLGSGLAPLAWFRMRRKNKA